MNRRFVKGCPPEPTTDGSKGMKGLGHPIDNRQ
jgi:hypothetical protein